MYQLHKKILIAIILLSVIGCSEKCEVLIKDRRCFDIEFNGKIWRKLRGGDWMSNQWIFKNDKGVSVIFNGQFVGTEVKCNWTPKSSRTSGDK